MKKDKKDDKLLIRLNKSKKELFKQKCNDNETTQTEVIDGFINDYIKTSSNKDNENKLFKPKDSEDIQYTFYPTIDLGKK